MNISRLINLAIDLILVETGDWFREIFTKELFNIWLDESYA